MTAAPRRTRALVSAEAALRRARERVAAGEPGWDPWRVAEAEARLAAAFAAAVDAAAEPLPEPGDGVPRMLRRAVRDGGAS